MRSRRVQVVHLVGAVACALGAACPGCGGAASAEIGPSDVDGGSFDVGGGEGVDGPTVEAGDGTTSGGAAGSLALVLTEAGLVEERLCDLDGDGVNDNAFADLGSPYASMFIMGMDSFARSALDQGERSLAYFPRVDDVSGPTDADAVLILGNAKDTDVPPDTADDFSGVEPFYLQAESLDGCGEPVHAYSGVALSEGVLSGAGGNVPLGYGQISLVAEAAILDGDVGPRGESAELHGCGVLTIAHLGSSAGFVQTGELTTLELLLSGGEHIGYPILPGLRPDVDLDGDGLESFVTDDGGQIVECVDGDSTLIEGRDCSQDQRMADGFSVNVRLSFVGAAFAGREPSWEALHPEGCPEGPPEESLLDPSGD